MQAALCLLVPLVFVACRRRVIFCFRSSPEFWWNPNRIVHDPRSRDEARESLLQSERICCGGDDREAKVAQEKAVSHWVSNEEVQYKEVTFMRRCSVQQSPFQFRRYGHNAIAIPTGHVPRLLPPHKTFALFGPLWILDLFGHHDARRDAAQSHQSR